MNSSLKYILKEIRRQGVFGVSQHVEELKLLATSLTAEEKAYLNNKFCQLEWGNHSLKILSILQNCSILTATEYVLSQNDMEHIQMVLNDFLEFETDLFANFLQNCVFNSLIAGRLQFTLEEFFRRLLFDLIESPNVISQNYLQRLRLLVVDEIFITVKSVHFQILLDTEKCKIREAFRKFKNWTDIIPKSSTLENILKELIDNKDETLIMLFNTCANSDFEGWKYFFILLQLVVRNCTNDFATVVRKHVKDIFKRFLIRCDERTCLVLFIIARAVFNGETTSLETYSQWLKGSLGEINYIVSAEKFKEIISILTRILSLETEPFYLQAHVNIAIPAPALCNETVLNYKRNCRKRLIELSGKDHNTDVNHSIVIDDDEDE